jgi:hypothetical protein
MNWYISHFLADKVLEAWLDNMAPTLPNMVWAALLTQLPVPQTPTPAGEVTVAGGYIRKQIKFDTVAANGRKLNTEAVTFNLPTADWALAAAPIIAIAIMDQEAVGGNWLWAAPICPRIVLNGDVAVVIEIGGFKAGIG